MTIRTHLLVLLASSLLTLSGCALFEDDKKPAEAAQESTKPLPEDVDPLAPPGAKEDAPAAPELAAKTAPKSTSEPTPKPAATEPTPKPAATEPERPPLPLVVSKTGESTEESVAKSTTDSLGKSQPGPVSEPYTAPDPWPSSESFTAPEGTTGLAPLPAKAGERRVDVFARDLDVRVAAHVIASQAGVELELSPSVRGNVSLRVKNEPWRRALERALAQVGEFEIRGQGDLIRIEPRPLLVEGSMLKRDAESVTVRRNDGKEFTCWLPPVGDVDREGLAAVLSNLAPGGQVALVCNAFEERLVLRSAVSSR